MANIELPTYNVIRPNEVYGKRSNLSKDLNLSFELTELVVLKKFKVPSQEDVIRFIQEKAREFDTKPPGKIELLNPNPLSDYFSSFPDEEVRNIANGQDESLKHLKKHSLESRLQRGEVYLEAHNGFVKSDELDSFPKDGPIGDFPYSWSIRFKLLNGEKLPDRLELDYLIEREVKDSNVFTVQGDSRNYGNVANQIRILSEGLDSPETIAQVKDFSLNSIEEEASLNLGYLYRCIGTSDLNDVFGGSDGFIEELLGKIQSFAGNSEDSTGNHFDGDPSRN